MQYRVFVRYGPEGGVVYFGTANEETRVFLSGEDAFGCPNVVLVPKTWMVMFRSCCPTVPGPSSCCGLALRA